MNYSKLFSTDFSNFEKSVSEKSWPFNSDNQAQEESSEVYTKQLNSDQTTPHPPPIFTA